jgi:hypothetical protein
LTRRTSQVPGESRAPRALLIGCHGGVGRAVLALLDRSAPGRRLLRRLDSVILLDRAAARGPMPLGGAALLPPGTVRSGGDLAHLVVAHRITQVIDLSSTDTVDCARACDDFGADFLSTSVEEWPGAAVPIPTDRAIKRLLPAQRPALTRSHLVGSGANPGIVNALVFAALEAFADRADVAPTVESLDLHAILITEDDSTIERDSQPLPGVFPMTWSPAHCLEELFEPRTFAVWKGDVVDLGHQPTERLYTARCGDRLIDGFVVPHEEVLTLAERFPSVEIAFIYRIPPAARLALEARRHDTSTSAWETRRLSPPSTASLAGRDRLGVLLCSRRFGELWMGFDTDVATGLRFGTNATQLQVAAGVIAGWSQLGRTRGIHFVEDLDSREFVRVVTELLGAPTLVHDRTAIPLSLAERQSWPETLERTG